MNRPSLLRHHTPSSQFDTRSPAYFVASHPSGKPWYTTEPQECFSVQRRSWGVPLVMQSPNPLQHYAAVTRPPGRGSQCTSACDFRPEWPATSDSSASEETLPRDNRERETSMIPSVNPYATQSTQAEAPYRAYNPLKRRRSDDEDASSAGHDTESSRCSLSASMSRYPDVISLHGGCVVPAHNDMKVDNMRPMVAYNTLRPPPCRLESMASITSFTMDSARALATIQDLAAHRTSPVRTCPSSSSSSLTPLSSSSMLEAVSSSSTAEAHSRLTPYVPADSDRSTSVRQSSSPMSQLSRSATPAPRETSVLSSVPRSPSPSPSPAAPDLPKEPSAVSQPLTYVVTTPAHVLASIAEPSAQPAPSIFNMRPPGAPRRGRPPGPPPIKVRASQRFIDFNIKDVSRVEEPPKKVAKVTPPPKPKPKPKPTRAPRVKIEAKEAALPAGPPDCNQFEDDRPPKDTVAQLAVGAGATYNMNRVKCLWPGCPVYEYPGELWQHIKVTHRRNAGLPKPSGNPILVCSWAPPGEPRANRCTYKERASKMWDHFMAVHHKESAKEKGEIACRLGQCTARSKNLDFQRHLEDVHWKLEGTVRWCEGCGVWKRFDKGRLLTHFQNCIRKYMESDPGFRLGLDEL
ncbi:hypothetical protein DAEQUDRAFT_717440 [Daedalea quercina L-15889]|uniref:Uncharacterized protein n=1 Tax=Daedalea quercina L-15889 TaxID=1314783 RepID=A0A165LUA7_9APHY|nr:hypothetical protein DAEQUDRAFT_717440 [Daedalea quercina L-15889]